MRSLYFFIFNFVLTLSNTTVAKDSPSAPKSLRFERQLKVLDKVVDHCQESDEVCVLVTVEYNTVFHSRYEGKKHIGELNPRATVRMIRVANLPWLALTENVSNTKEHFSWPLFPRKAGGYGGYYDNGLNLEVLIDEKRTVYESSQKLVVTAMRQGSIYRETPSLDIGYVDFPKIEKEHEILPHLASTEPIHDSYTVGLVLPLKLNDERRILSRERKGNSLEHVKLVGISVPDTSTEEGGSPYRARHYPLDENTLIYRLQFEDTTGQKASITSLETVDL